MSSSIATSSARSKPVILVVDDTDASRYAVCRHLQQKGFEVLEEATGQGCLKALAVNPDLIILDVKLPDIIGYEVCRAIKRDPATAGIPVLQISSTFTSSSDRVTGLDHGADAFLTAPIDADELIATVKALLRIRQAEAAAREAGERLNHVLSSITDVYFALDMDWRFVEVNRVAAENFFNHPPGDLIGRNIWELFPQALGAECYRQFHKAFTEAREAHFEARSAIVTDRWFEIHAYPRGKRLDIYQREITERRAAEEQLRASQALAAVRAEELERLQSILQAQNAELEQRVAERTASLQEKNKVLENVMYSVAHCLRAPARAMEGFSTILLSDFASHLPAQARDYLGRLASAARNQDQLINDLFEYVCLWQTEFPSSQVDLCALLDGISAEYSDKIRSSGASLRVDFSPQVIQANGDALHLILRQFIDNALKFTRSGVPPQIDVTVREESDGFHFTVTDNGTGIAPEFQDRIFRLFERLDPLTATSGTGVGLALAKTAVDRMKGRMGVISTLSAGSSFWFQIPKVTTN